MNYWQTREETMRACLHLDIDVDPYLYLLQFLTMSPLTKTKPAIDVGDQSSHFVTNMCQGNITVPVLEFSCHMTPSWLPYQKEGNTSKF